MKLLAGILLFLLCAWTGESKARRLRCREQTLSGFHEIIREIGDRQRNMLLSFREGALLSPPSPERDRLLRLAGGEDVRLPFLTAEEGARLTAYVRSESCSVSILRTEEEALLALLRRERDRTREELAHKGQVYRSVGYLSGVAALLLVL